MSRSAELVEKAKQLSLLLKEVNSLASKNNYGVEINGEDITFEDWLSSSCYGEGDGGFSTSDGSVWYSSSC